MRALHLPADMFCNVLTRCMDEILQHVLQPLAMAIYMNDHVDVYNKSKGLLPTALLCCPLALHYLPNVLDFSCTVEPLSPYDLPRPLFS